MFLSTETTTRPQSTQRAGMAGHLALQLNELIESIGPDLDDRSAQAFILTASALLPTAPDLKPAGVNAANSRGGLAPWQLRRVTAHVEANLEGRLSISDLAALTKRSESQFCRSFKASMKLTPTEYVLRQRIGRAKKLMLQTGEPTVAIALACGFADQAHFCSRFRKVMGDSPSRWRKQFLAVA